MTKTLNNISGFLVKSVSETMRYILVMITILGFLFFDKLSTLNINVVFFFGIVNYALSFFITDYLKNKSHENSYMKIVLPVLAIAIPIISVLYLQNIGTTIFKLPVMVVYILIWKKGMDSNIEDDDIQTVRKVMLFSLIIISFIIFFAMLITAFTVDGWYLKVFKVYVPIYLIVTILYMDRVSRMNAYSKYYTNTINKEKNINRFNIISTVIVITCLVAIISGEYSSTLAGIWNLTNKVLEVILYPVALLGVKISAFMGKFITKSLSEMNNNPNDVNNEIRREITNKMLNVGPDKYGDKIVQVISIFKWILVGIFVAVIVYLVYKNFRELFFTNKKSESESEEKDFILPSGKSFKRIKRSLSNIGGKLTKNSYDISKLPAIRQIYIQIVKKLKEQGFEYKDNYTPNEYLANIERKEEDTIKGFDIVTGYYNKLRYGNKELDKNEIEKAMKIKEQMDG